MKKLVITNQKGGVGKSAIICQYAHYLNSLGYKVLVIDMDHQRNTSKALLTGDVYNYEFSSFDILTKENLAATNLENFTLIAGSEKLNTLEKNSSLHNLYLNNFVKNIEELGNFFDICLMDTNPNPDIRQIIPLVASNFLLSPIQLNQEAVDGISGLLKQVKQISTNLNPNLKFLGILPNIVESTPFHKENLAEIENHFSHLLIKNRAGNNSFIKKSTSIAEAQAKGISTNKLGKTSGFKTWSELKNIFDGLNKIIFH